jgi:hypothetical protein
MSPDRSLDSLLLAVVERALEEEDWSMAIDVSRLICRRSLHDGASGAAVRKELEAISRRIPAVIGAHARPDLDGRSAAE